MRPTRWILNFLPCVLALVTALTPGLYAQNAASNVQPEASDRAVALVLDVGDLLDMRVFDTPELSEKLRVDDLGQITLPVAGALTVKGMTVEQAQSAIADRFRQKNILRNPHVDVLVLEYATQGVTVGGEVKTPGVYPWAAKHTVQDFISIAGGPTPSASKTVTVTRHNHEQVMTFQLGSTLKNPAGADLDVQPGDRIVVARAGVVYVVGDVGRAGGYLIENKETITVLQAIALAQGMNKTAKYDGKLIRTSAAGRTESDLPLKKILANRAADPKLQDGDIVYVPVSGSKQFADKGISAILQAAVGLSIWGWQ